MSDQTMIVVLAALIVGLTVSNVGLGILCWRHLRDHEIGMYDAVYEAEEAPQDHNHRGLLLHWARRTRPARRSHR